MTTRDEANAKRIKAVELRAKGWSLDQIAEELGYADSSGAHRLLESAYVKAIREPAAIVRHRELDQIDMLIRKTWEIIDGVHYHVDHGRIVERRLRGDDGQWIIIGWNEPHEADVDGVATPIYKTEPLYDTGPVIAAINTCNKLMERRAKLLGLDAPKVTLTFDPAEVEAEIERLRGELGPEALRSLDATGVEDHPTIMGELDS